VRADPGRPDADSLRRTFASILVALGENPAAFMRQMGHTDAALTLRVYAQAMESEDGALERLAALVEPALDAPEGHGMGNGSTGDPTAAEEREAA
jgi:integrase